MPKGKRRHKFEEESAESVWPDDGLCPLCQRALVPGPTVNYHHLVPKAYGGKRRYAIHTVCHSKIHSLFMEHELAAVYNTFEGLREQSDIAKFIHWLSSKPPTFTSRHQRSHKKDNKESLL
ncbi:MAG TPA: hypothetical protein VE954_03645 [Oligoflexus sp.]|uniref:hypothetical protein n=1 Tax=Oligoflexus sp. TaxID=1971216 RepID=UPI002D345C1B|nr:hypothetical protein [Oligoflexus sp.]HYX32181.1 hypothetical protein [Oligoflexus sp.]